MPSLTGEQVEQLLPRLKALFYAAGSVQGFARPFLSRGVKLVSAWRANAVAVSEFTVAQIILSAKGYFRNTREYDGSEAGFRDAFSGHGAYGETIGVLGAGAIGKRVIELLRNFHFHVLVWDPFLSERDATEMKVEKTTSLTDLFSRAYVVTNHLADKDETAGLLVGDLFTAMRPNATFINTGRGRTVDEPGLVRVLTDRPDLTALLDVTFPEPAGSRAAIMHLPNARVSSHIAGTIGDEVRRMADLCIEEFDRFAAGKPLQHEVDLRTLATMA
jgi:phosphoglycerate dehydrogenase-like enzyme